MDKIKAIDALKIRGTLQLHIFNFFRHFCTVALPAYNIAFLFIQGIEILRDERTKAGKQGNS